MQSRGFMQMRNEGFVLTAHTGPPTARADMNANSPVVIRGFVGSNRELLENCCRLRARGHCGEPPCILRRGRTVRNLLP